jgi:DNA invertase Pin-like site-specific DNA recombinase
VQELKQKGAHLKVLEPEINTRGPMGKTVLTILGMVAEMELDFIYDKQRAGIETAKARGVYKGWPVTLDHQRIAALRKAGKRAAAIAREIGCSRGAAYKVLMRDRMLFCRRTRIGLLCCGADMRAMLTADCRCF